MALGLWTTLTDPYKNTTGDYILVLGTSKTSLSTSASTAQSVSIILKDPGGNIVALFDKVSLDIVAPTGANVTSIVWNNNQSKKVILIPNGFELSAFTAAYGIRGTLEELRGYI